MLTCSFIGLVLLTFVTVVAVPCNLVCLPVLRLLDRMRPQSRSPLLLLLVALPWLLGGGVLISSVVDIVFGACDAGELCLWNEDPHLVNRSSVLLVVPLLAGICLAGARLLLQLIVSRRAVSALERTSVHDPAADIHVIPSPTALAFAARGRVFVSSGLRAALAPAQFRAVLLHERAHLDRSDNICQLTTRILSCALLPPLRRKLLGALTLANEQSCDEAAGAVEGRLVTAAAILAAQRLGAGPSRVLIPAFAESFATLRLRRLMEPEPAAWRNSHVYAAIICGLLSTFLLGDVIYYTGMLVLYSGIRG